MVLCASERPRVTWEAAGVIAEAIGALAVIATLIYLSVQIRENSSAQATNSLWMMTQVFNQTHESILNNPEIARLAAEAKKGELTDEIDVTRLYSLLMPIVNGYYAAWRANKSGHLPQDAYEALIQDSKILNYPGFKPLLTEALDGREPEFLKEFFGRGEEDA